MLDHLLFAFLLCGLRVLCVSSRCHTRFNRKGRKEGTQRRTQRGTANQSVLWKMIGNKLFLKHYDCSIQTTLSRARPHLYHTGFLAGINHPTCAAVRTGRVHTAARKVAEQLSL